MKNRAAYVLPITLLLALSIGFTSTANSAMNYWSGSTAAGAMVTDEDCPLVVEHENLTLDLRAFPERYYDDYESFFAYPGKVTAEYHFYNPADYTVTATLDFPFGSLPDYGSYWEEEIEANALTADAVQYEVMVNGEAVVTRLRHTYSQSGYQFDLERDLVKLSDSYMDDTFYSPDLTVTKYTFEASGVDTDRYDFPNATIMISADPNKTKVVFMNHNDEDKKRNGIRLAGIVHDEPFVLYVIGEPLAEMNWVFYEDNKRKKEMAGTMTLTDTEVLTFKDLALLEYDPDSGILEHDWYNAVVASMYNLEMDYGIIRRSHFYSFDFDVSDQLMRWYEYELVMEPGERLVNQVTAPIYPAINGSRNAPDTYYYTYLLSPATTWAEFGSLEIKINTPFFMSKSTPEGFVQTDSGYEASYEALPKGELTFSLTEEEIETETEAERSKGGGFLSWLFPWLR